MAERFSPFRPLGNALARFSRDTSGVTAIEFGMVAWPFFMLLFAIIQSSLVFLAGEVLDDQMSEIARKIRTGQKQIGYSADLLKQEICKEVVLLPNCAAKLNVYVDVYGSFEEAAAEDYYPTRDEDGEIDSDDTYTQSTREEIVSARIFYVFDLMVPSFGLDRADVGANQRMLASVITHRNEPF